ncbi:AsnC family transcriptional regulator [Litoreibacter roseus]|uniref:AsnC family transcriptional regulator n=2 Tax=Litoreibacter roseus TaxID=2601869 RepID=A0A6N6JFK1_9RHOB|nr:AsnC family transcriptional regulator [Litoreibacter roseus]
MIDLDQTDRNLIAALRQNARASVTTLAADLGVARATIQTRLDRLVSSGTIQRFTVELQSGDTDAIHAIMTIAVQGPMSRAVTRALRNLAQIIELHSTNGAWDMVARIEAEDLQSFDRILREVREIPGVLNTETSILLARA